MTYAISERKARKIEEAKAAASMSYCIYCGKGTILSWIAELSWLGLLLLNLVKKEKYWLALLPNNHTAHRKCLLEHTGQKNIIY